MAMNFSEEEKKKMLEDDSEIYQKREDGLDANNGELKKLKGRQKREYFRQYGNCGSYCGGGNSCSSVF